MTNPWDLPSGSFGPGKPYTLDVLNPRFGIDPQSQYNPTTPQMFLEGRTDDPDWAEFTLNLTLEKKGWNILEDGQIVKHDNQNKLSPAANTLYGRFIFSAQEAAKKGEDWAQKLLVTLQERGNPTDAKIWKGLRLVIGEVTDTFKDKDSGEQKSWAYHVIVGYEGLIDSAEMASLDAASEQAVEESREKMRQIALAENDHSAFANRVLTELNPSDPEVIKSVMKDGDDGFYKTARREAGV